MESAAGGKLSFEENADLVAEFFRLIKEMRAEEDGLAGGFSFPYELQHHAGGVRIESAGRLVEDEDVRIVDECTDHSELLLHSP